MVQLSQFSSGFPGLSEDKTCFEMAGQRRNVQQVERGRERPLSRQNHWGESGVWSGRGETE